MLLSVVIPFFNASATLERTLRSVHANIAPADRAHVELVLIDDGSTDDGLAIAAQSTRLWDGPAVHLEHQANGGVSAARNRALEVAGGRWVLFLDADDELAMDPLPMLREAEEAGASSVAFGIEWRKGAGIARHVRPPAISASNYLDVLTARNPFAICSLLVRRSAITQPFPETVSRAEDWAFWLSNPDVFARVLRRADKTLARVHIHGGNASAQYRDWGEGRVAAAEWVGLHLAGAMGLKHRNNLALQSACGRFQQGKLAGLRAALRWPCSSRLYAKYLVYALAACTGQKASRYA